MQYETKYRTIDALQIMDINRYEEFHRIFFRKFNVSLELKLESFDDQLILSIKTNSGWQLVENNDFIVVGYGNETYPVKQTVFLNNYQKIEPKTGTVECKNTERDSIIDLRLQLYRELSRNFRGEFPAEKMADAAVKAASILMGGIK